jgi:hypothetical protein
VSDRLNICVNKSDVCQAFLVRLCEFTPQSGVILQLREFNHFGLGAKPRLPEKSFVFLRDLAKEWLTPDFDSRLCRAPRSRAGLHSSDER